MPAETPDQPRQRQRKEKLTAQQIAETALRLVGEHGLCGLTMRALSEEVGVQAPVIYRLVADKQALLDEMAEALISRASLSELASDDPYADLAESTRRLRRVLLNQRDGAHIVAGSFAAKHNTLRCAETVMAMLNRIGLPEDKAMWAMMNLFCFTLGEVMEEQGLPSDPEQAKQAILAASATVLDDGHFKHLNTELISKHGFAFDQRFEFGLKIFLIGIREEVAGGAGHVSA